MGLGGGPGLHRLHDLVRDLERAIDLAMDRVGRRPLPDAQRLAVRGRQHHRDDLVGEELLAQRGPRGVHALIQEALLDRDEQVVGEHAEEDVGLDPMLQVMKDRPLHERTLHGAEGVIDAGQEDVQAPDLLVTEILAIGLEQIPAVELLGLRFLGWSPKSVTALSH